MIIKNPERRFPAMHLPEECSTLPNTHAIPLISIPVLEKYFDPNYLVPDDTQTNNFIALSCNGREPATLTHDGQLGFKVIIELSLV